ncbi:DUF1501 domain-containing protein [Schlesneria sp.]|uniref:DUF1501 domain-containing protein n=1 Tax=Schlesneria sp. TaxID=2762018 RepID=UPI002EF50DD9
MTDLSYLTARADKLTRRHFFGRSATGLGTAALASLLGRDTQANNPLPVSHIAPRAKRVIWMFQSGAPSQMDLFDYKPRLAEFHKQELPASIRMGQRLTGMTSGQSSFPVVASKFKFAQHGQSGTWLSEMLPHTAKIVDEMCLIRSMHTEAINHDPAITFIQTGSQLPGRPSFGSWVDYGLGTMNEDLPAFVVMISNGATKGQGLLARLWGSGFLPSQHQGVKLRGVGDPVLYLSDPQGMDRQGRRQMLDGLAELNGMQYQDVGDPEITARIAQYELAFRMQTSVPELMDLSHESPHTFELYGEDSKKPGTYAANCLLARRLVERGVRFIQLYHRDWDHHGGLPARMVQQCKETDQASAALVMDLKQRGLLDDTLVIWGGEFGRTVYCQGAITDTTYGRDHHPRCFSMWMAGGGVKPGTVLGETDEYSYNIVSNPVHVHDLQATILNQLGLDHTRLTYRFQGRDFRLTDVHGKVVSEVLA